jgi:N-carbamoylputrescine amidase
MARKKRNSLLTIGAVQMSMGNDVKLNLDKALRAIEVSAKKGAQIVCLPELFRSRYFPQSEDTKKFQLAEPIPGPTTEALSRLARKNQIVIIGSVFENRSAGIYHNTAVILGKDGSLLGRYRKMHIPDDPHYYEKFYFTPGDLGFLSFDTEVAKVGVLICWDQWFPEAARLTCLSGAEILFYPTAIGWLSNEPVKVAKAQETAWETVQRAHAVANGTYVVVANRVGREGKIQFWGHSFVASPYGEIIARAKEHEEVLIARCDLGQIAEARQSWPFLRDRRIDAYGALTARFLDEETAVKAVSSLP